MNDRNEELHHSHGRSRRKPSSQGEEITRSLSSGNRKDPREIRKKIKTKAQKTRRRIIAMIIAECLTLTAIFGYAFFARKLTLMPRPDVDKTYVKNDDLQVEDLEKMKGYWMIAVFGVDSRDGSVGAGNQSDVNMICCINQDTGEIKLVSLFRDTYLNTNDNGRYGKFNEAYARGGPEQALKFLNKNLDLNITDYITFSWKAVADVITILDGVDVEISKAEFRYINSYITETVQATGVGSHQLDGPGFHHLDGVQAVAYARLRKMDSDYARTERQRKIIELAFDKAKKADYAALNNILMTVLPQVSNNLDFADLTNIALSITKYHIGETMGFPSARGEANMGSKGACVIPQTLESNVSELHTFLFGDEAYTPTDTVKQISAKIASDTGMYSQGKSIGHVSTEGYLPNDSSSSNSSGSKNTETTAAESTAEPETDEDGNIIETTAADGTKHPGIGETDENGNLVDGPEEDESSANGPGEIIQYPGSTTESRADDPVHPGSTTETTGSSSGGIVAPDGSIIIHPGSDGKTDTKGNSTTSTDDMRGPGMTPETTAVAPHPGYPETTAADHSPSSTISETTTEAVEPGGN